MNTRNDKRTTVSLAGIVWEMAEEQMVAKGFNDNFSAYCADLIRRDREEYIRRSNSEVTAFMDHAANKPTPVNSSASPAFQAIFDAGVAAARAGQSAPPAAVQPVTYSIPAKKGRKSPRKPLKK